MLASFRNGTLCVGVTSDLLKRVWQHKNNVAESFTKRYGIHILVWYEIHESMLSAIEREKAINVWKRKWKLDLFESTNPEGAIYIRVCFKNTFRRKPESSSLFRMKFPGLRLSPE
jgi:putative endonuclease